MPTGDVLAVLLFLAGLIAAIGVAAYSLDGSKARNLWLTAAVVALASLAWLWWQTRFDAARVYQLLIAAMPVIVITLVVIIVRSEPTNKQQIPNAQDLSRKRNLIDGARRLAALYARGNTGQNSFRQYLETSTTYAAIRGHLDSGYLSKLNDGRTVYVMSSGARYEPVVQWFLDDVDRLEKVWGIA